MTETSLKTNNSFTSDTWHRLLKRIAEKTVIPIIGNEMYEFELNGKIINADEYLALKLLGKFDVTEPTINTIASAAEHLVKNKNQDLNDIKEALKDISESLSFTFPLINKLTKIKSPLFFTNTAVYTNLLEKALKHPLTTLSYSCETSFIKNENEKLSEPYLFNVFGTLSKYSYAAVTEEEMLEFTASFQERMNNNPEGKIILENLKTNTLLFLGCGNPEWMMRFFMRVLSNERMFRWQGRPNKIIVVNNESQNKQKQFEFLNNYGSVNYPGNTSDFVNELTDRWAQFPDKGEQKKIVFISYTQKDVEAVTNLINALSKIENLHYWYDKDKLFSGDNYENEITENIKNADIFIPLISENSISRPDAYVLKEWDRAKTFDIVKPDKTKKYLMPIRIDKLEPNDPHIPKYFRDMTISEVPMGNPNDEFINNLKRNLNLL